MIPTPRPYQERAIEALRGHVRAGRTRVLLVGPTGSGKTVVAAAIIRSAWRNFKARVLFISNRMEHINQTVNQLARVGITEVGVIMADDPRTNLLMPVQVGTVQTLDKRSPPPADIVFVDEAHHGTADSYQRVLSLYPDATIIGLTATPCRLDGKPLGQFFQALEVAATYEDLIRDQFIVPPIVYGFAIDALANVRIRQGDYVIDELETVMNQATIVGSIVDEWIKHNEGRSTVVFACTIKHSLSIVERFASLGYIIEHLDSTTPEEERKAMLVRLERGETQIVSNVGVLTEGWDSPPVKCLSIARPTKSLALWRQMGGRGLRPWHPDGLASNPSVVPVILDHGRNAENHGLPHEDITWSLDQKARKTKEKSEYRTCPFCFAYVKKNPCELCGKQAEVQERKIIEDKAPELKRLDETDPRRVYFMGLIEKSRANGFKPGYPSAKFKEKYNSYPPWSWSNEAKQLYQGDRAWQARVAGREREREFWKERDAEKRAEVEVGEEKPERIEPEEPEEDTLQEEMFATWLKNQN